MKNWTKFLMLAISIFCVSMTAVWAATQQIESENIPTLFEGIFQKTFPKNSITAKNSQHFSGKTSTQFVKKIHTNIYNSNACEQNLVITGFDEFGKPICQTKQHQGKQINILEGNVTVRKLSKNKEIIEPTIKDGKKFVKLTDTDLQFTTTDAGAVLQFDADLSIIRMDKKTSIKLSHKANFDDSRSMAQVTLENGILWGRVLNNAKIDFAYGQIMAGVRGTSILMTAKTLLHPKGYFEIIDSQKSKTLLTDENIHKELSPGNIYAPKSTTANDVILCHYGDAIENVTCQEHNSKKTQWIKSDLAYMNSIQNTKNIEENVKNSINSEIRITKPEYTTNYSKQIEWLCKSSGKQFWKTITDPNEMCQDKEIFIIWKGGQEAPFTADKELGRSNDINTTSIKSIGFIDEEPEQRIPERGHVTIKHSSLSIVLRLPKPTHIEKAGKYYCINDEEAIKEFLKQLKGSRKQTGGIIVNGKKIYGFHNENCHTSY